MLHGVPGPKTSAEALAWIQDAVAQGRYLVHEPHFSRRCSERNVSLPPPPMNCPNCARKMTPKTLPSYDAGALLGMRSVKVESVPALVCPKCKHVVLDGALLDALHEQLLLDVLSNGHVLGGEEVRFIRKALSLSQAALADRLGVHRVTVARWETGEVPLDGPTSVAIRALAAIPVVAERSKAKGRERVKASFEKPLTTEPGGSYILKASA